MDNVVIDQDAEIRESLVSPIESKVPERLVLLEEKLKQDLAKAQEQQKNIEKQLEDIQRNQQILVRQKIAIDTLVNYLMVSLSK